MKSVVPKPIKDDVRKQHKELYSVSKGATQVKILDIPSMKFIVASGIANVDFNSGVRGIRECNMIFVCNNRIRSYTVREQYKNFIMSPFELEWGNQIDNGRQVKISMWVPQYVTHTELKAAMTDRLGSDNYPLSLEESKPGMCAQTLHTGHYNEVGRTIERIKHYIEDQGFRGDYHQYKEIHMSHVSIGWPEKTNLIIRVPISEKS
ncbi:hypothetical protein [Cohnella thailandensis]|uniref:GyrI-like small molecule binding domain-containing protein n=1 Tax=Cohnella thailandensis TaxID=557557 RepID=A0A841SSG0_9BACL|nr:hypothetical protein [Cohnella thailandensis]MBB6635293.1 hypothetical protein [Cohnella thailandensis]MBP1974671.1 hypothetical protein [Cohnella thailandensis]